MNHQPGPTSAVPFASTQWAISRRRFLRGAGVALPLLESMRFPFARAAIFESLEVFYNSVRRYSPGFLSPTEFERTHNQTHR